MNSENWHENQSGSSCREWVNEKVKESESVTFEHRHENKSCSACRDWVNERVKEWESEIVRVLLVPSFCLTFRHFLSWDPALWTLISGAWVLRLKRSKEMSESQTSTGNHKCLCWYLGHADQLLFSCLCSKVTIYRWKLQWIAPAPVTLEFIELVPR